MRRSCRERRSRSPACAPRRLNLQLAPHGGVIGGLVQPAWALVDIRGGEAVGGLGREQEMVDAQALVLLPAAGLIVPIAVAMRLGMQRAEGVDEAEIDEAAEVGPA